MTLSSITTADLAAELARRQKGVSKLQARREKLVAELTGIENDLRDMGLLKGKAGRGPGRPKGSGKRPRNDMNLSEALTNAADIGAVLSPAEAASLVQANGYHTKGKTFGIQVATALTKHEGFKRIGRGQYKRVK